jgi:hypothetical protein
MPTPARCRAAQHRRRKLPACSRRTAAAASPSPRARRRLYRTESATRQCSMAALRTAPTRGVHTAPRRHTRKAMGQATHMRRLRCTEGLSSLRGRRLNTRAHRCIAAGTRRRKGNAGPTRRDNSRGKDRVNKKAAITPDRRTKSRLRAQAGRLPGAVANEVQARCRRNRVGAAASNLRIGLWKRKVR